MIYNKQRDCRSLISGLSAGILTFSLAFVGSNNALQAQTPNAKPEAKPASETEPVLAGCAEGGDCCGGECADETTTAKATKAAAKQVAMEASAKAVADKVAAECTADTAVTAEIAAKWDVNPVVLQRLRHALSAREAGNVYLAKWHTDQAKKVASTECASECPMAMSEADLVSLVMDVKAGKPVGQDQMKAAKKEIDKLQAKVEETRKALAMAEANLNQMNVKLAEIKAESEAKTQQAKAIIERTQTEPHAMVQTAAMLTNIEYAHVAWMEQDFSGAQDRLNAVATKLSAMKTACPDACASIDGTINQISNTAKLIGKNSDKAAPAFDRLMVEVVAPMSSKVCLETLSDQEKVIADARQDITKNMDASYDAYMAGDRSKAVAHLRHAEDLAGWVAAQQQQCAVTSEALYATSHRLQSLADRVETGAMANSIVIKRTVAEVSSCPSQDVSLTQPIASVLKRAEDAKAAADARAAEQARKLAEAQAKAEAAKQAAEEQARKEQEAQLKKAEEARQAAEAKKAEEARQAAALKKAEEAKKLAAAKAEAARKAEALKKTEEAKAAAASANAAVQKASADNAPKAQDAAVEETPAQNEATNVEMSKAEAAKVQAIAAKEAAQAERARQREMAASEQVIEDAPGEDAVSEEPAEIVEEVTEETPAESPVMNDGTPISDDAPREEVIEEDMPQQGAMLDNDSYQQASLSLELLVALTADNQII